MQKSFVTVMVVWILFFLGNGSGYAEDRYTFTDAPAGASFADVFTDSQDADWYQIWTGDPEGINGNFVDAGFFNDEGRGWIQKEDLSQLAIDFAQADATALWIRSWDDVNGFGDWVSASVDFSAATAGKITQTLDTQTMTMDQMFVDHNVAPDTWYRIWIGDKAGTTGNFAETSHLNTEAPGWVNAKNLDQVAYTFPPGMTTRELWVMPFSKDKRYNWEHWSVSVSAQTYKMTDYFPMAGSWETDQRTLFINTKERVINGITVKEMVDTRWPSLIYWTNDENGLRIHGHYEPGVSEGIDGQEYIEPTPFVFAEAVVSAGSRSTHTFIDENDKTVYTSCTLIGTEDVTVPAGTFAQCLKFRITDWDEGETEGDNGYETLWLAKDIGFVKAVNTTDDDETLFTAGGQTRQLMSYYVPSGLTADQQAIQDLMTDFAEAKEGEDITGLMAVYSENFSKTCLDKTAKQALEQTRFDNSTYNKYCVGTEEIIVNGNMAHAMQEFYARGTAKSDGSGWQYHGRESSRFIKENGTWYAYGNHMDIDPVTNGGWFSVSSRNQEWGSSGAIAVSFHDCITGTTMASLDTIASFTITGPDGSGLANADLLGSWDSAFYEFWNSALLNYDTMPSGFYTFRVEDTLGNFYSFSDYFEKQPLLEIPVPIAPADGDILPPGDTTLTWTNLAGVEIDYYRIDFETQVQGAWQRQNINTSDTHYTVTLDPDTSYRWRIKARQQDRLGGPDYLENESRNEWDYFSTSAGTSAMPLSLSYAYLQYRTQESGSDQFRGWCTIMRGDDIAYASDITQLVLKDASDVLVPTQDVGYWGSTKGYYNGRYDDSTGQMVYTGPFPDSGFSIRFPDGTALSPGTYTYQATTSEGETLTLGVEFPGQTTMPFVTSSSMTRQWNQDGSLMLSWTNPEGAYDQIRIVIMDQDWNDLLYLTLHNSDETVTIPASVIQDITTTHAPTAVNWQVQTRVYNNTNNNYARGYSNTLNFTWTSTQ